MTRQRSGPQEVAARMAAIVEFIRAYQREYQRPPTLREIGEGSGIGSVALAQHYVVKLAAAGRVRYEKNSPRSIMVIEDGEE